MSYTLNVMNIPADTYSICLSDFNTVTFPQACTRGTYVGPVIADGVIPLPSQGIYQFYDSNGIGQVSFLFLSSTSAFPSVTYVDGVIYNSSGTTLYIYMYDGSRIGSLGALATAPTTIGLYYVLTADTFDTALVISCFTVAQNHTLNNGFNIVPNSTTMVTVTGTESVILTPTSITFQNRTCGTSLSLVAIRGTTASLYAQFGSRCSDLVLVLQPGLFYIGSTNMAQEQYGEISVLDGTVTIVTQPVGLKLVLLPDNVLKIVSK
jgi:hypothetical protein